VKNIETFFKKILTNIFLIKYWCDSLKC
jgi:hypothetical protein